MSEWKDVGEPVHSVTLTMSTQRKHCAMPIPLNGPTNLVRCLSCKRETPTDELFETIALANMRVKPKENYQYAAFDDPSPECARCGNGVSIAPYLAKHGASTTLPCGSCGARTATYPAPPWLKAHFPNVLQVFGGDADIAHQHGGVDLPVDQAGTKPVAMACPKCGGGLTIGPDTERTVACQFCSASVFIPDALWKELHPVKTMLRWTLTFTGELMTEMVRLLKEFKSLARPYLEKSSDASPSATEPAAPAVEPPASTPDPPAGVPASSPARGKVLLFVGIAVALALSVVVALRLLSSGGERPVAPTQHPANHGKR
jgi:ribosomal protein S27AE